MFLLNLVEISSAVAIELRLNCNLDPHFSPPLK